MAPLLDRLRRRPTTTAPPTTARSDSGRAHTSGFLDFDESNRELIHPRGAERYDEMWRTDADCRRALTMVCTPLVAGIWTVQPAGDDDDPPTPKDEEIARFVKWALMDTMRPSLPAHLWTALTVAGRCGFAPFEQIWQLRQWQGRDVWTIQTLDLRLPRSVQRWEQDGPDLTAIEQFTTRSGTTTIPARDLLYYRMGAEGDNWEGTSLLRPAFKHWRYKDAIEEIQAIGIERTAIGVPTGYPPANASPADLDAFEDFLSNVRANQSTYFLAPGPRADHARNSDAGVEGWWWEFVTPSQSEGSSSAVEKALSYHSSKIDATVIAEFMRLGQENVGARATADVQQDPFLAYCEVLATIVIEDAVKDQLIRRLVDLNFEADGRYPALSCSLIDSTSLAELAAYVGALAERGAIRPEPTLEAYLRKRADLPEADEDTILRQREEAITRAAMLKGTGKDQDNDGVPDEDDPSPAKPNPMDAGHEGAFTLGRQDRPLRGWEQVMSLDRLESALDGAQQRLEHAAGPAVHALALAVARGQDPDEKAVADAVAAELAGLYLTGRETVREELARQRAQQIADWHYPPVLLATDEPPEGVPPDMWQRIVQRAGALVTAIRAAVVAAVGGARARARRGQDPDPAMVQQAAEEAAIATVRQQAQQHASQAVNEGRVDEADLLADEIAGSRFTSVLDGRRCNACARADDDVLRPLDDPVRLARIPPLPDCHGGARCRCMEAYTLKDEEAPSA